LALIIPQQSLRYEDVVYLEYQIKHGEAVGEVGVTTVDVGIQVLMAD
jgi:hypothetical protein